MSGFSYWHLTPVVPIILGIVGVALNRSDTELARWPFGLRVVVLFIIGAVMAAVIDEESDTAIAVAVTYMAASWILVPFWAVSRLRHMGIFRKYWAVLTAIPVVGLFYTLYLLLAGGDGRSGTPPVAAS